MSLRWFKVDKESCVQPRTGSYSDWKEILADESHHQCVYCAIPDDVFGGSRHFHVEHYRPKGREEFSHLLNDMKNLFYSCSVCNTFKGDDWPGDPDTDLQSVCYPDPSKVDYNLIFMHMGSFEIDGLNPASRYVVRKLCLNRRHLILERRKSAAMSRLRMNLDKLMTYRRMLRASVDPQDKALVEELTDKYEEIIRFAFQRQRLILYKSEDLRRL